MVVADYINNDFKPLNKKDTEEYARDLFDRFKLDYMPVVDNNILISCLPLDFYLVNDEGVLVEDFIEINDSFFVLNNSNLLETLKISGTYDSDMIPVLDQENLYIGYTTQRDIMSVFSKFPFFSEVGGVLVVKRSIKEYGVSEIAQIVESENAKILGLFVSDFSGDELTITMKINQVSLGVIEASLKRYGYTIVESYHENKFKDDMKDRYDALMSYLDV